MWVFRVTAVTKRSMVKLSIHRALSPRERRKVDPGVVGILEKNVYVVFSISISIGKNNGLFIG